MKNVISISLGASSQDFRFSTAFLGAKMRVRRLGADGSLARAIELLAHWDGRADAIGIGLARDDGRLGTTAEVDRNDGARLRRAATRAPVTTGARLGDIFLEWAVRGAQDRLGHYFDNASVLFFSGTAHHRLATTMSEYTPNLLFADPLLQLGIPKLLTSLDALHLYERGAHHFLAWMPPRVVAGPLLGQWSQHVLRKALAKATVVVARPHELDAFGIEELAGKTVVTATVNEERMARFGEKGVAMVVDASPAMHGHVLGPDLLDAMILAATGKPADEILEDDYLDVIAGLQAQPRIVYPNGFRRINRFAFVIHPL